MANQWQRCTLDDDSLQQLTAYKAELSAVEAEIAVLETAMKVRIFDLNRTTKVAATFTTKSDDLLTNHRLKFTATTAGTAIEKYTVILGTPGANASLVIYPPVYGVVPTGSLAKMFYDANVIYVEVETDSDAAVLTTPADLKAALTSAGYDALFTTIVVDSGGPLPLVADGTQYKFTGGKDTPLSDLIAGFNDLYAGTGKDVETALEQFGIPVAKSGQSSAEVLAQTTSLIPLSTGKLLKCDGDNLVSLRAMWTLLGETSAAATTVCGLLPGQTGYPLVVWTQQVTTTVSVAACDGGGTRTSTETVVVGNINQKPTSTSELTPYVFWLESISLSVETLKLLSRVGLNDTQVQTAVDASNDTVYVIPEPSLLTTYSVTCAELLELLQLTCEGIESTSVEEVLTSLGDSPATAANGFLSAAFNLPGGGKGINIRNALSPETSMTNELSGLSQTKCIDPFAVGSITSLIASASAMIDMATSTVERVRSTVMGTLNTISGIVANIQGILSIAEKLGCLIPLDFMASVKAPALDSFLLPQIDLAIPQINGLLDTVQAIMEKVQKVICQIVSAINSLIGAALSAADCLVPGLSNAIANAFGALLPNPLDALPCIENPFDLVGLFQTLLGKVTALSDMIVAMINDILSIASQLQLSVNIQDQTAVKEATGDCSSGPLGAMASSIKSKLSV